MQRLKDVFRPGLKVAMIDDEHEVLDVVESTLRMVEARTVAISESNKAIEILEKFMPQAIILDKVMPNVDGDELTKTLRSHDKLKKTPIIMLTALDSPEDMLDGFLAGVDDYILKPFSPKDLLARVHAVTARNSAAESTQGLRKFPAFALEIDTEGVRVLCSGKEAQLTLTEFTLLTTLSAQPGKAMTREELGQAVLGKQHVTDQAIDMHIASLRKKLGKSGDAIITVRGVGYRFT